MTADVQIGSRLAQCEQVIKAGLSTFVDVGNALMEIREGKLYRETHKTFESYCNEKWGITKVHAHRLMNAAEVSVNIKSNPGVTLPTSEKQIRPLAHLQPEEQKEVWKKAVEIGGGKPTAKQVQAAVEIVVEQPKEKPSQEKPIRFEPDEAWLLWLRAKGLLDQISARDKSLTRAMEACKEYAEQRLTA